MRPATEISPRFVNKRPQRRYLKIGIAVVVALLALVGLAFAALMYRAPVVVVASPTPLPPLPSVDFSGQPALIVEYGKGTTESPQPSSSELDLLAPMTTNLSQPSSSVSASATTNALPLVSASSQPPLTLPSVAKQAPQLTRSTSLPKTPTAGRPPEPKRRSPNKVALPTLPPADFSVTDPVSKPIPQSNTQPKNQARPSLQLSDNNEGDRYVLVGGSFATRPQAEVALLALKSKGLGAKIVQENKRYRLQSLQLFQGPDAAMQAADQLAQHGLDVVIRKVP